MLVPIKPVKCDCGREKFKDWYTRYTTEPVPKDSKFTFKLHYNPTLTVELKVNDTVVADGDDINDSNLNEFTIELINDSNVASTFYVQCYDGHTVWPYYSEVINEHKSVTLNVTKHANVVWYRFQAVSNSIQVSNDTSTYDVKLSDIVTSDLITSTEDEFLNTYYANWCIVDPFDDFESELKVAFMLAEDKLTAYKSQLTDFNPGAHTVMSVDYGERGNTEYGYRYPIGGDVDTSAPNTGAKSTVDKVTDTTTVDKNEEPFKNLDKTKAMDGWLKFFVDQFKDCFTLCEAMTW